MVKCIIVRGYVVEHALDIGCGLDSAFGWKLLIHNTWNFACCVNFSAQLHRFQHGFRGLEQFRV